jgi:hypothetical protein
MMDNFLLYQIKSTLKFFMYNHQVRFSKALSNYTNLLKPHVRHKKINNPNKSLEHFDKPPVVAITASRSLAQALSTME